MTIVITWAGVWSVAKYALAFGAGFVCCFLWAAAGVRNAIGRAFGW